MCGFSTNEDVNTDCRGLDRCRRDWGCGTKRASRGRVPGGRVPAYRGRSTMKDDRTAKLYAGQMGIAAVLVNVLMDKGVITQDELRDRFEQAHAAASRCS